MNEKLRKRLLATFKLEAGEHLRNIRNNLISIEQNEKLAFGDDLLEETYRNAHSLKGAARAVGLSEIVELCQNVENVFSELKKENIARSPELFDLVQEALNLIEEYIDADDEDSKVLMLDEIQSAGAKIEKFLQRESGKFPQENEPLTQTENKSSGANLPRQKGELLKEDSSSKKENIPLNKKTTADALQKINSGKIKKLKTVRISTERLNAILLDIEELLPVKNAIEETFKNLDWLRFLLEGWKGEWNKSKILFNELNEFFESFAPANPSNIRFKEFEKFVRSTNELLNIFETQLLESFVNISQSKKNFNKIFYDLNLKIKEALMLPFSSLSQQFPTMMRDVAKELGKNIDFMVKGAEVELDKRIIEELKDPLVHLLRNALDHGIEMPEERISKGKPPKGKITLEVALTDQRKVEIIISDDGRGIDEKQILNIALKKNLLEISRADQLSKPDILNFIFESGFSTAQKVSELSGRGLGMSIVKDKINKLGGSIKIETEKDKGTSFIVSLPVFLKTTHAIIFKCAGRKFGLNINYLTSVVNKRLDDIKFVNGKQTIEFNNKRISVTYLDELLQIKRVNELVELPALILNFEGKVFSLFVDEILGEKETLIRPLPAQIKEAAFIEGVMISSDGGLIPILKIKDLFKAAQNFNGFRNFKIEETSEPKKKKILVVDDSITSRVLISEILSQQGYDVSTATDGKEAWLKLKNNRFDILLTDIEMPVMDGFELTAKIRQSEEFADLPIVLISGLQDEKSNKERGFKAGANAYIVKSNFKQENLIEVIEGLISK